MKNRVWTDEDRLKAYWNKIDPCRTDGCYIWVGAINKATGYGVFWDGVHTVSAHCFLLPAPEGFERDHLCKVKACVNLEHLEVVTHRVINERSNSLSSVYSKRTHCINGHEFNEENTAWRKTGSRVCRECRNAGLRRLYRRKKEMDRTAIMQAVSKALAYKAAGKDEEAAEWAGKLIQLLKEADIQWYT